MPIWLCGRAGGVFGLEQTNCSCNKGYIIEIERCLTNPDGEAIMSLGNLLQILNEFLWKFVDMERKGGTECILRQRQQGFMRS